MDAVGIDGLDACLLQLAKLLPQAHVVERRERQIAESAELPLEPRQRLAQRLAPFPFLSFNSFGIGIAPVSRARVAPANGAAAHRA